MSLVSRYQLVLHDGLVVLMSLVLIYQVVLNNGVLDVINKIRLWWRNNEISGNIFKVNNLHFLTKNICTNIFCDYSPSISFILVNLFIKDIENNALILHLYNPNSR